MVFVQNPPPNIFAHLFIAATKFNYFIFITDVTFIFHKSNFILVNLHSRVYTQNMNNTTFKKIRVEKGYTQKQLAEYLGLTDHYISYLENGHKPIVRRTELAMNGLPHNDAKG